MVARSLYSAGNQAWSRPRALADPYLGAAILSHRSDGNCHQRTIASQKADNSVRGLLALFPLERDLVGTAKNRCANSP
jgi:hypothetical protein